MGINSIQTLEESVVTGIVLSVEEAAHLKEPPYVSYPWGATFNLFPLFVVRMKLC